MDETPYVPLKYRVPFVPSHWQSVRTMVELAAVEPGQRAADLGSGDGRVLVALAKVGAVTHGFEINLDLVVKAEEAVLKEGLDNKIFVHWQSYWEEDLSSFAVVTLYGMSSIMGRLEEKLAAELKPGPKVVSNVFTFPHWQPVMMKDSVYLYVVDDKDRA